MPLEKQLVSIPMAFGLNQKVDDKYLQPGQFKSLKNVRFVKGARLDKRNGTESFTDLGWQNTELETFQGVAKFENELLAYDGNQLYSYSQSIDRWFLKGQMVSCTLETKSTIRNSYGQYLTDMAVLNGISVTVYEDISRDNLRCTVEDLNEGTILIKDQEIRDFAYNVNSTFQVISSGNNIYIFYGDNGSNIYGRVVSTSSPFINIGSEILLVSDAVAARQFFALNMQDQKIAFAYIKSGLTGVALKQFDLNLSDLSIDLDVTTTNSVQSHTLFMGSGFNVYLALVKTTIPQQLQSIRLNNGYNIVDALTTVNTFAINTDSGISISGAEKDNLVYAFVTKQSSSPMEGDRIVRFEYDPDGTLQTQEEIIGGVNLYTNIFQYNGRFFMGINYIDIGEIQQTYFLIRDDGLIVAKQKYAESGMTDVFARNILKNVSLFNDDFVYSLVIITRPQLVNDYSFTNKGIDKTMINFTNTNIFRGTEIGNSVYFPGGILQLYDGSNIVESGFHIFPDQFTISVDDGTGDTTAGTHKVILTYEWIDQKGQIHISAPSLEYSFTGSADQFHTVNFPRLNLSAKTDVILVVYMTEAGGDIFYRATSIEDATFNDDTNPWATTIDVIIDISDADLITRQIIYTTGGVFANISPPASSYADVFKGRLFLAGMENPNTYFYSKENKEDVPIEFATEFSDIIESKDGPLTAISTLDDKLFLWKDVRPYFIFGDGPNDLGVGAFSRPQGINTDVGCEQHHSIVRFPSGLLFKSEKGIYSLNSGLTVEYVGAQVEDFNSYEISSAVLNSDDNEIRFTTTNSDCLIYNYYFGQWSTFENYEAKSAISWNNNYLVLRNNGILYQENNDIFKDDGTPINISMETGWISLAGVQGFQRIIRLGILGSYKSQHLLRITIYYDYKLSASDVYYVNTSSTENVYNWGEIQQWGEVDTQWGGDDIAYHYRFHLSTQKCTAIKLMIEDIPQGGSGESLSLSGLSFEFGVLPGIKRTRVSKSLGAS